MNQWIWVVLAVLVLVVLGLVAFRVLQERRTRQLRHRFGPEYDRAIEQTEDRRAAEAELTQRAKRRSGFDIRPLSPESCERYDHEWRQTQARFVDEPLEAVALADNEVMRVMRERGYPVEDFDQRAADLSVDHPNVVENYRTAREISQRASAGEASTEDLRVAMIHYRTLFEELLETDRHTAASDVQGQPTPEETP